MLISLFNTVTGRKKKRKKPDELKRKIAKFDCRMEMIIYAEVKKIGKITSESRIFFENEKLLSTKDVEVWIKVSEPISEIIPTSRW